MHITRIAALVLLLGLPFVLVGAAWASPFNYAREHPAYCAEAWAKKTNERAYCGGRDFCAAHKNDDRISRIICDVYVSRADPKLDSITLSGAWLDAARNLKEAEIESKCELFVEARPLHPCNTVQLFRSETTGGALLPDGMKTAKLALRAHFWLEQFGVTVVRLGIGPHGSGVMDVTWGREGSGHRETHSARLKPSEIDRLLAAVNRSDFWRLPYWGEHILFTGEVAAVELSVAGWKHQVKDGISYSDAADLSILVNELIPMIKGRWKDVPA